MNRKVAGILKELGLWRVFIIVLILRSPFEFLNAILGANMLESFLRLAETRNGDALVPIFWRFLLCVILLFAYNAIVWCTISIKADMLFHKRLRKRLLESMLSRTKQEMEEYSVGDWITRLNSDVDKTADYLTAPINFMHAVIAGLNLILSSVVLIVLNTRLFIVAILIMAVFFYLSAVVIIKKIPAHRKKAQEAYAEYTNWMEPIALSGAAIRIYEGQEIVMNRVEEASNRILRENVKAHRLTAWSAVVNIFSGNVGYLLLLLVGNCMMGSGIRDFAQLSKITQYRAEMMRSVMCVNNCMNNMRTNLTGAERVEEVLNKYGI